MFKSEGSPLEVYPFTVVPYCCFCSGETLWPCQTKSAFEHMQNMQIHIILGPVVQSVVSLTSSLMVISLTVLADSIYNILIFFAEKM